MKTRAPIYFAWLLDTFYCLCIVCLSIREVTFSLPIIKYIKQYSRGAMICVYLNHIGVFARSVIKISTKNRHIWLTHIKKKIVRKYFSNLNINIHLFIYKKHHLLQMSYVAMYLICLFLRSFQRTYYLLYLFVV